MRVRIGLVLLGLAVFTSSSIAHFHVLVPNRSSVKKGDEVTVFMVFGHPFEHQLFDMAEPRSLVVLTPDGKTLDLTKKLEKKTTSGEKGKKVTAYQARYTPLDRGDHVFVLQMGPVYLEDDREYVQDTVKAILHVQAQKGWDATSRDDFEWAPLTRPYGLRPGMVFQAQINYVRQNTKTDADRVPRPVHGALVEIERFNPKPPASLPPDEHVTRTVKTDPSGVVTATLPDPGWWGLTVARPGRLKVKKGDKEFPGRRRCTLWVHVDSSSK